MLCKRRGDTRLSSPSWVLLTILAPLVIYSIFARSELQSGVPYRRAERPGSARGRAVIKQWNHSSGYLYGNLDSYGSTP